MTCSYCYSPQPIFSAYDYFSRKGFVLIPCPNRSPFPIEHVYSTRHAILKADSEGIDGCFPWHISPIAMFPTPLAQVSIQGDRKRTVARP